MKRVLMIERDGIQHIDNGDGTVTVRDLKRGITQVFRGNRMINHKVDPDKCRHENAYLVYDAPDGRMRYCPQCLALVDEEGEITEHSRDIPF